MKVLKGIRDSIDKKNVTSYRSRIVNYINSLGQIKITIKKLVFYFEAEIL